jgi:hypothetical protein
MYDSQHFEWLKENVVPKKFLIFDAVSISYAFITQFVNMINCINFPCKGDDFSFVSIKLAAYQQRTESMSDRRIVLSLPSLLCKIFILSANKKYLLILNNNNSIIIYYSSNLSTANVDYKTRKKWLQQNYITKHTQTTAENNQQKTGFITQILP